VRVLIVAPELPVPPLNGLRVQLSHLSRQLATRHEVCAVGFRLPEQHGEGPPGVRLIDIDLPPGRLGGRLRTWLGAATRGLPFSVAAVSEPLARAVAALEAERRFDVAHVASSVLADIRPALGGTPSILAALDAWHLNAAASRRLAPLVRRPVYAYEEWLVRRFESRALRPYHCVVVVSEEDAAALRTLDPALDVEVIPNGVDTVAFAPCDDLASEAGHIVFTGVMSWAPNVAAARFLARDVLPRVRAVRPDAHLSIVGRAPRPEVLALQEHDGVRVTGEVQEMRPWLCRAEVYACPMISGTGIKNKLLEALACGTPAVATTLACRGLGSQPGRDVLVADDSEGFAAAILRLLEDSRLGARLGAAGRRHVVARHSWDAVAEAYERVYVQAVNAPRTPRPRNPSS
jgi:polysaccharide biosynthesis protein PslH